ncbi:MAG TPA: methyltransferase domain-containing protein, partial [Casimicrobiaceae bacterium]|nr:methyltransferase domain-containing protein [Casimicrobiaceae bacterium]
MTEPRYPAPDPRDVDPGAVRRGFARAAATYDDAAALQHEIGARMNERLEYVKLAPTAVLDAGCGTGDAVGELAARYPAARVVAFDVALPMVERAGARSQVRRTALSRLLRPFAARGAADAAFVCADIVALPFAGVAFDLVWSNLALQWVNDLPRAFAEFRRVLKVGGLLSFTTFGPDTLRELRSAFAGVDARTHTSRFVDMHDIGDMLVNAGFADPVMDMEYVTLTYETPRALLAE